MPLIVYLDEAGDPSLSHVDRAFPLFSLALVIVETECYAARIVPAVYRFKLAMWGHEGVVLHSRDIRKGQGACAFLTDPHRRSDFYAQLNALIMAVDMSVLAVAVQKAEHVALHGDRARAPYDLALRFAFERLVLLLEDADQTAVVVVAESRTPTENAVLRSCLYHLVARGTSTMGAERFQARQFQLEFIPKVANIVGTQLADLIAYPVARYALNPMQPNPAFALIEPKLCRRHGQRIGLAVYPDALWAEALPLHAETGDPGIPQGRPSDQPGFPSCLSSDII